MVHNITESLKVEQSQFERQDGVYRRLFGHKPHRIDYNMFPDTQRDDIDLTIMNKAGIWKTISEKYRPVDYGDILLEVWSVFPNKHGWAMFSHAKVLAYWFPTRLVLLDMHSIVDTFRRNRISEQVYLIDTTRERVTLTIDGEEYNPWVIRAVNTTYSSISVALNFESIERLGISYSLIPSV